MSEQNNELTQEEQDKIDAEFFSAGNIVPSNWFKFSNVGDRIKGFLLEKRMQKGSDGYPDQVIYKLEKENGEVFNVGISVAKQYVIEKANSAKIGQMLGFAFLKEIPNPKKGLNAIKSIEVFVDSRFKPEAEPQEVEEPSVPF